MGGKDARYLTASWHSVKVLRRLTNDRNLIDFRRRDANVAMSVTRSSRKTNQIGLAEAVLSDGSDRRRIFLETSTLI